MRRSRRRREHGRHRPITFTPGGHTHAPARSSFAAIHVVCSSMESSRRLGTRSGAGMLRAIMTGAPVMRSERRDWERRRRTGVFRLAARGLGGRARAAGECSLVYATARVIVGQCWHPDEVVATVGRFGLSVRVGSFGPQLVRAAQPDVSQKRGSSKRTRTVSCSRGPMGCQRVSLPSIRRCSTCGPGQFDLAGMTLPSAPLPIGH